MRSFMKIPLKIVCLKLAKDHKTVFFYHQTFIIQKETPFVEMEAFEKRSSHTLKAPVELSQKKPR